MIREGEDGAKLKSLGDVVVADLLELDRMKQVCEGIDTVVHMAGNPSASATWKELYEPNILGTYNTFVAAKAAGFDPVKINAVAIKGVTEDDVVPLARFAREHGLELRFIEYMPLDAGNAWERGKVLFASEILDILTEGIGPLAADPNHDPRAPAMEYDFLDGIGRVMSAGCCSASTNSIAIPKR